MTGRHRHRCGVYYPSGFLSFYFSFLLLFLLVWSGRTEPHRAQSHLWSEWLYCSSYANHYYTRFKEFFFLSNGGRRVDVVTAPGAVTAVNHCSFKSHAVRGRSTETFFNCALLPIDKKKKSFVRDQCSFNLLSCWVNIDVFHAFIAHFVIQL